MEENRKDIIDIREVVKLLLNKKKHFFIVWFVTFVLSCAIIFPVPRTYSASVTVAPEASETSGGTLSSIASSFGFNLDNMASTDAFYPDIYPDVINSKDFIVKLLNVKVQTEDGTVATDYYTYLKSHQKITFYMYPLVWVQYKIGKLLSKDEVHHGDTNKGINTFRLTKTQSMIFDKVRANVSCSVDKKTGIITIGVTDQDPLVCATIADSAKVHLQNFITHYRTNKARIDCEYYSKLLKEAKKAYDESMKKYVRFCDTHVDMVLQSEMSTRDVLENEMSQKLNTYNTLNNQLSLATAKVQERTPAFSQLEGATVPIKATGPKRVLFVIGMLFLSTFGVIAYVFKKDILNNLKSC